MNNSKVVAITGTSRGIGFGIAKYFLSQGYIVFGCGRSEVKDHTDNYHYSIVNITDEKQVRNWFKSIQKIYNR